MFSTNVNLSLQNAAEARAPTATKKLRSAREGIVFMKKWFITFAVLLSLLLTIGVSVGAFAAAEPEIAIKYGNLKYKDGEVALGYAVSFEGVPKDAERGLLVWQGDPAKYYLKGREDVILSPIGTEKIDGKEYTVFSLDGIAEKELTDEIYAVAYARVGTRVTYSSVNKHSPLRYTYIIEASSNDTQLLTCLSEMLASGAAAQRAENYNLDRLADADFVEISLNGGLFADNTSKGLYVADSLVKVTAEDVYGKVFSAFVDSEGNSVSESNEYIRVPAKSGALTATYVDATTGLEFNLMAEGASFDSEPPASYVFGEAMRLPVPKRDGYAFAGWYMSEDYDVGKAIDVIEAGMKGDIKLYAAWTRLLWEDDYTKLTDVNVGTGSRDSYYTSKNSGFRASNKDGTTYISSENGVVWHNGTAGSQVDLTPSGGLFGLMGDSDAVTVRVRLASVVGRNAFSSAARIRVSYKNETIPIFNISTNNSVYLGGDQEYKIATLTDELQSISVCINFADGSLTAVDENGCLLATRTFSIPSSSKHKSYAEWKADMKTFLLNWYASGCSIADNAIAIGGVEVWEGNAFLKNSERTLTTDELEEQLAGLLAENTAFSIKMFESSKSPIRSTDSTSMPVPVYNAAPRLYDRDDKYGTRLMFTSSMLYGIIATMDEECYSKSYTSLLSLADSDTDGILAEPVKDYNGRKGLHNYDASVLARIEAKAFMYRLMYEQKLEEGSYEALQRDVYGYSAIVAIKNFLHTLDIQYISSDQCREFGYTMFVAAEVYDWCYPLLSQKDMEEIKYAVVARCCSGTSGVTDNSLTTNNGAKMEVGFPPAGQGSVSGHGSEAQILRDYLSFALAIYDEDPTWWEYVAGRVVGDYIAVRNVYHESGITQQGVSNYAQHRHYADLYSAWILQTATGVNPYTRMEKTVVSVLGSMTPGQYLFSNGDGGAKKAISTAANLALISSALYNNDTLFTWAHEFKSGFNLLAQSGNTTITLPSLFIFLSQGMELVEDKYEGLDLIQYNGYPLGQIISRSEWNNPDAAATYMKLGIRTTANHEHCDSGTFHIYYKGLLTSDSGLYDNYGHEQTQQYHQATVAHNGLLVFNPAKWNYNSTSSATKWYSGGQRKPSEAKNLDVWLGETYDTGVLMGAQYGYKDAEGKKADYAYIAGDITKAYTADTVSYITRSMLTVYTENPDFPMYFFVFDSIESTDASFKKTFLLHAMGENEPTVEGNVITIVNGDGKLVSHTLTEGASIEAVGGIVYDANGKYDAANSRNYLINGYQIIPMGGGNDGNWGRVEVSVSGSKKSSFMHAMYVTDRDGTATAPSVEKIAANGIEGAIVGDVAAVFRDTTKRSLEKVSFTTVGEGELKYYVAGLFEGSWKLTVDGKACGTVYAGEGGMAIFTAPRGEVLLTPGDDVMPEGGGHIFYELGGGKLPEGAPTSFKKGGGATLPTPTNGTHRFVGWYTSPSFGANEKITKIPSNASGEFTVYAKWDYVFLNEDFEESDIDVSGIGSSYVESNVTYSINGGKGTISIKRNNSTKAKHLTITPAGGAVSIVAAGIENASAVLETKVTYTLSLATNVEEESPTVIFSLKGKSAAPIFTVTRGRLFVGDEKIADLTETLTEYSFTVDFENDTVSAYDSNKKLLATMNMSGIELTNLTTALFELNAEGGIFGTKKYSLLVGDIYVRGGGVQ